MAKIIRSPFISVNTITQFGIQSKGKIRVSCNEVTPDKRVNVNNDKSEVGSQGESKTNVDELRTRIEQLQSKLRAAKIAYLNRTELNGKILEYEDLAGIAKEIIGANYQLQKELYGKVKLRLSVAKLLRASSR
jgi:hypothetical protein